jgi:hypothetical protein
MAEDSKYSGSDEISRFYGEKISRFYGEIIEMFDGIYESSVFGHGDRRMVFQHEEFPVTIEDHIWWPGMSPTVKAWIYLDRDSSVSFEEISRSSQLGLKVKQSLGSLDCLEYIGDMGEGLSYVSEFSAEVDGKDSGPGGGKREKEYLTGLLKKIDRTLRGS